MSRLLMRAVGSGGQVELYEHFVRIKRKGVMGALLHSGKGEKDILLSSITAIQLKAPGVTKGYIQFVFSGSKESKGGAFSAAQDENSVMFGGKKALKQFSAIRDTIYRLKAGESAFPDNAASSKTVSPLPSQTTNLTCPHCNGEVVDDPELAGQVVQCPHCENEMTMPVVAKVRAVRPATSNSGFPAIDTTSQPTSTFTSRSRPQKKKQNIPVKYWVIAGVLFLGFIGMLLDNPKHRQGAEPEPTPANAPTSYSSSSYSSDTRPVWQRKGFHSEAQYNAAKGISDTYGQDIDEIHAAQEMLRQQGLD